MFKTWRLTDDTPPSSAESTNGTIGIDFSITHAAKIEVHGEGRVEIATEIAAFLNKRYPNVSDVPEDE